MKILDVIFPKKILFVQVAVPFFGHKVVNFCHQKKKKPWERDTKKKKRGKKKNNGEDGGTCLSNKQIINYGILIWKKIEYAFLKIQYFPA